VFAITLLGCSDGNVHKTNMLYEAIQKDDIQSATKLRIVFAHQSVGGNIVEGVRALAKDNAVNFNIAETQQPPPTGAGMFHFKIGTNGNPDGKLAEFEKLFSGNAQENADVAILKLCYIDFTPSTDGAALAGRYIQTIDSLQAKLPHTVFIPVTAPLTVIQAGPKAWIKKMLGQQPAGYQENAQRAAFNAELRHHFATQRLFDLAKIEATAETIPTQFAYAGRQIEALTPAITSDGGHLNAQGERLLASELLKQLVSAASRATPTTIVQ
jgi:lysophospholipase L1-like esterase